MKKEYGLVSFITWTFWIFLVSLVFFNRVYEWSDFDMKVRVVGFLLGATFHSFLLIGYVNWKSRG